MKRTTIKPAVTSNAYSIGNHFDSFMGSDNGTLEFCKQHGITMSAWSPLGGVNALSSQIFNNDVIKSISQFHKKSVAQIALRWLVQKGIAPVTGGFNSEHLRQDLDIFDFSLTDEQMALLDMLRFTSSEEFIVRRSSMTGNLYFI